MLWDANVDNLIKSSENQVGILAYWYGGWTGGGHYVAIEYDGSNFIMHNGPNGKKYEMASVNEWLTDNNKKYLCLITI